MAHLCRSDKRHRSRSWIIVQQPKADGDVVTVAAVVDGDGSVEVEQASLLAVVEHEDVQLGPESSVVPHRVQQLRLHVLGLAVRLGPTLNRFNKMKI